MNKVIITVLAACAVIGAVWILCADCHAEDYAEQMVQAVLDGDDEAGHAAEVARATKLEQLDLNYANIIYDDLVLLSKIITAEAGSYWLGDDWRMMMGEVVLNRVESPEFPDTLREVLEQPGQYYGKDSAYFNGIRPHEYCVRVALRLLAGERLLCDPSVVFQANFPQGSGIHTLLNDRYLGATYLCHSAHMEVYRGGEA